MTDSSRRANDYPVPVPAWWPAAVERELERLGMQKRELADSIGLNKWDVSRCLHGKATLEAIRRISRFLKIPTPVVIFDTEHEALAYQGHVLLRGLDAQMATVAPRTNHENNGSPPPPSHGTRGRRRPFRTR